MKASVPGPRVLIVDRSDENREVLRTALERRGVAILEAHRPDEGLRLVQTQSPSLIVVDLDTVPNAASAMSSQFKAAVESSAAPLLFLGSVQVPVDDGAKHYFVRKPYHYAPLLRKIEAMLAKAA